MPCSSGLRTSSTSDVMPAISLAWCRKMSKKGSAQPHQKQFEVARLVVMCREGGLMHGHTLSAGRDMNQQAQSGLVRVDRASREQQYLLESS